MIPFNDVYRIVPEGSDTTEGRRFLASKRTEDYILVDQRYGQYVTVLWIHSYFLIFLTANVLLLWVQFFMFIFFSFLHSSPHTTFYFLCLFKCGCRLSFLQVPLFVANRALNPDVLITFLRLPFSVCFDIIFFY